MLNEFDRDLFSFTKSESADEIGSQPISIDVFGKCIYYKRNFIFEICILSKQENRLRINSFPNAEVGN
jgi:hypothetical protein